jgi:hypothetical protein
VTEALTASDTRAQAKALRRRLATFEPAEGAPDWMPTVLLRHLVALPTARRAWSKGVGRPSIRALLIRAGAGRRRDYDAASQTARSIAGLVRREPALWDITLQATFEHYGGRKGPFADDDLVAIAHGPGAYLEQHPRCAGEYVIVVAFALGSAGEDELAAIAELVAARLEDDAAAEPPDEDAERHRIQGLEDLVGSLTRDLEERERRLRGAERELEQLRASLGELREAEQRAGDADARLAAALVKAAEDAQTIAALRGEIAASKADAERLAEAEAQAAESERLRADLEQSLAEHAREHELRREAQAEADRLAEQLAQLSRAQRTRPADPAQVLPVDDPAALLPALGPVVGQAALHAAERMTAGHPLPDDKDLLRLSALVSELVGARSFATAPPARDHDEARPVPLEPHRRARRRSVRSPCARSEAPRRSAAARS